MPRSRLHRARALAPALAALFALALALAARLASAEPAPARPVIDALSAALLDVMKHADALGYAGRRARLEPVLDATYDYPAMAQRSLGGHWAALDAAQRARFVAVFRAMSLATYASRFDGFAGERFETLSEEPSVAGTVIVRSVLHTADDDVSLDYRLRSTPAGWRVIDVYLDGTVSELALRRAEYGAVLERDGFDALVAALERKAAAPDAAASSPSRLK